MSLAYWHDRLDDVQGAIQSFTVALLDPPIIAYDRDTSEPFPGLRLLRDEVKRDCEALAKSAGVPALSTNAPYLVAVWDELVHARQPVAIYRTFVSTNLWDKAREKPRIKNARSVKVDIVAENGARWVRVNTIKNARLLMEFREIDSYLTSDEDEKEARPRLAHTEFDNSVLRMGRELLAAAKANLLSNSNSTAPNIVPKVTMRLTRLDPFLGDDPRIEKTVQCLRDMGIDVQLGERPYPCQVSIPETLTKPSRLEPTTTINLDLSALIALISDISHSPLPKTEQEAHARFEPPQNYLDWKRDRLKSLARQSRPKRNSLCDLEDGETDEGTWDNSGQHSRALAAQAIQEMNKGLLEEIHERISALVVPSTTDVTFWTTSEARYRCLQIVSKIGGERERQRADALLGSMTCTCTLPVPAPTRACFGDVAKIGGMSEGYWGHSRYPPGFLPLVPVHVYPSTLPTMDAEDQQSRTTFFDALARTCTEILSREASPTQASAPSDPLQTIDDAPPGEIPPTTQTLLPKLTVHTVISMLAGASRGHTTLTTNRSSVKAILKNMRRVNGRGEYEPETGDVEKVALWVVDPRSLSEGMRSE